MSRFKCQPCLASTRLQRPAGLFQCLRLRTKGTGLCKDLFANCITSGETSPASHKSHAAEVLQSGTNFQTRIISQLCGREGLHLPATGENGCLPVPPLPRVTARRPRLGLHSPRRGAGLGGTAGDLKGAKFREGPRRALLKLAGAGSFCLLLSGFLSRSRTLSPLPRSHPALFPPLRLRVRSVVTSAEIPPNSSAQWRAGGRPSLLYAGRSRGEHSALATVRGGWGEVCKGDRGDGRPLGLRSEAQGPRRLRLGTET